MLRDSARLNGLTGLAITKLDVLDGLPTVRLSTGYQDGDRVTDLLPFGAEDVARCEPIYEDFPGWEQSTFGVQDWDALPENARRFLERLGEVCGVPIDLISTGPERDQTIVRRHPYA